MILRLVIKAQFYFLYKTRSPIKLIKLYFLTLLAVLCSASEDFVLFDFEDVHNSALPEGIQVLNGANDEGSVSVVSSDVVGTRSLQLVGDFAGSDGRGYRGMAVIRMSSKLNVKQYEKFQSCLEISDQSWQIQFDLWVDVSSMAFFKLEFGLNSATSGYQKAGGSSFLSMKEKDLKALGSGVQPLGQMRILSSDFAKPILPEDTFYNFTFKQNSKTGILPTFYIDNIKVSHTQK